MFRELVLLNGDPRPLALLAGATLAGTSFTSIADEAYRTLRGDRKDPS